MRRLMTTLPDHPPYGGEIADPIPRRSLTLLRSDDDGRWAVDRHWPFGSD